MGTRVDFYVGRGTEAEWLGSYPFDGLPGVVVSTRASWRLFGVGVLLMLAWLSWQVGALVAEVAK